MLGYSQWDVTRKKKTTVYSVGFYVIHPALLVAVKRQPGWTP